MIPDDEIDIHVDEIPDKGFIARAYHRSTNTIKISDIFPTPEEATKHAKEELWILLRERLQGLGS